MEKLQISMILEILGRPAENVSDALKQLADRLAQEKGAKILQQTLHQPTPVKDSKDLFTSFGEFTLELESLSYYFGILFAYMPANVELISPERITLSNNDLNFVGNRLLHRLHDYDAITKKAIYERDVLMQKLKEIAPHLFKPVVSEVPQQATAPKATKAKPKTTKTKSAKKKK